MNCRGCIYDGQDGRGRGYWLCRHPAAERPDFWADPQNYSCRVEPFVFLGIQPGEGRFPDIELYNLTAPVGDHPEGSTVSRQTLEAHGYHVPACVVSEQARANAAA
jgi:hypothetical protein